MHFGTAKTLPPPPCNPFSAAALHKIAAVEPGRSITYERVKDYWGAQLPNNRGRNNFDVLQFDYYRDETVQLESFLAGRYDLRQEYTAKLWATSYNTPALKSGALIKQDIPNELPVGMQGFVLNQRRPQFQDIRVREALDLAFDFAWEQQEYRLRCLQADRELFCQYRAGGHWPAQRRRVKNFGAFPRQNTQCRLYPGI